MTALTDEQRARLVEVMAKGHAGTLWHHLSAVERQIRISAHDRALAAAERAGFRIEGPADG